MNIIIIQIPRRKVGRTQKMMENIWCRLKNQIPDKRRLHSKEIAIPFPTQYGVSFKVAYDDEAFENEVLKEAFIQKITLFLLAPIEGDSAQEKVNPLTLAMGEEEYQDVTHLYQKIQITPISKATFCFTIWYEWH